MVLAGHIAWAARWGPVGMNEPKTRAGAGRRAARRGLSFGSRSGAKG